MIPSSGALKNIDPLPNPQQDLWILINMAEVWILPYIAKDAIKLKIAVEEEFILSINIVMHILVRHMEAGTEITGQAPEAGREVNYSREPLEERCPAKLWF